jgi:hypothetical protein
MRLPSVSVSINLAPNRWLAGGRGRSILLCPR